MRARRAFPLLHAPGRVSRIAAVALLLAGTPRVSAEGSDPTDAVREALEVVEGVASSGYLRLLEEDPGLTGTLRLVLMLRPDGGFTATALEPDPGLEPLALALDSLLDTLRVSLSEPLTTAVTVEMPLQFRPLPESGTVYSSP